MKPLPKIKIRHATRSMLNKSASPAPGRKGCECIPCTAHPAEHQLKPRRRGDAQNVTVGAVSAATAASKLSRLAKPIIPANITAGNVWIAVLYFMTVSL